MRRGVVVDKDDWLDHEAGSKNIFRGGMKPMYRWFVFVKFNPMDKFIYKYDVTEDVYNAISIGDRVEIGTDKYGMPEVVLKKK